MRGHCYDALVGLAGCDKSLPGLMMAMLRLNVPSVFMYGGSILPGRFQGRDVTVVDVFEASAQHSAGKMSDEDLHELECAACPSAGSCGGQFTANTMACVSEAIGLALPGSAGAPAPYEIARCLCRGLGPGGDGAAALATSARATSSRARRSRTPRRWSRRPAARPMPGCICRRWRNEAGIDFDLHAVGEIFKRTPYIADLKPGGRYVDEGSARDRRRAGADEGAARRRLSPRRLHHRHRQDHRRESADVKFPSGQDVVARPRTPLAPTGGVVVLKGNLAPQGAIVKVAGMQQRSQLPRAGALLRPRGGVLRRGREARLQGGRRARHPLRGAARRAGHARDAVDHGGALRPGHGRQGRADHRRPLLRRDARLLHRPCRAGGGGRRARSACSRTAT